MPPGSQLETRETAPEPGAGRDGLRESIHFVRSLPFEWKEAEASQRILWAGAGSMIFVLILVMNLIGARTGSSRAVLISPFIALALAFFIIRTWRLRKARQAMSGLEALCGPSPCRLVCLGSPAWLEEFGPLANVPFQPAIFFTLDPVSTRRGKTGLTWALAILLIACFWCLSALRGGSFIQGGVFKLWTGFFVAYATTHWILWPTYYRIVPGRLDIVEFSNVPWIGTTRCTSISLRDACVLIDLQKSIALLNAMGTQHQIPFLLVREPRRFAHTLLMGTVSTYEPAPLPHGELVG